MKLAKIHKNSQKKTRILSIYITNQIRFPSQGEKKRVCNYSLLSLLIEVGGEINTV